MSDPQMLREQSLPNGLTVQVTDVSRHYFGGYWQVAIEISCLVPLTCGRFEGVAAENEARSRLGEHVPFVRRLERMAVRGEERDTVLHSLLERYQRHLLPFLANPRFPEQFLAAELKKHQKKAIRGIPCLQ